MNDGPNNPEVEQVGFAREISSKLRPRARPMSREQIEIDHMYPLQSAGSMTNMMRDGEGNFYDADGNFLPPPKPTYDNREFMSAKSDIRETAQDLSEKGRYGDTEVVHVNPQEVEMLKKMGGSGTINPETGLREFFTFNGVTYDSFTDAIDGGGAGGSGSEYFSGTHEDYKTGKGKNDSRALSSDNNKDLSTFRRITGYDDLTDARDGGGMGMKGDNYGQGNFSQLDVGGAEGSVAGDGYISDFEDGDGLKGGIDGDNDTTFAMITNIAALAAGPVAYGVKKLTDNLVSGALSFEFSKGNNEGEETRPGYKKNQYGQWVPENSDDDSGDATTSAVSAADAADAISVGNTENLLSENYSEHNPEDYKIGLSTKTDGLKFQNYDYTDGTGRPTSHYTGSAKPMVFSLGETYSPKQYSVSEGASNDINNFISKLSADDQDALVGNINVLSNANDDFVLYIGDEDTGYVEATYSQTEDGYTTMMEDIEKMFAFSAGQGDYVLDGGFIGRNNSFNSFANEITEDIEADKGLLIAQLGSLDNQSADYEAEIERISGAIDYLDRELLRRSGDASTSNAAYSLAAMQYKAYQVQLAKLQNA